MDLTLSPDDIAFRDEVRAFFADALPEPLRRGQRLNTGFFSEPEIGVAWNRILHARGWIAPAWPVEHGGTGWSLTQRHIFEVESNRAGAPYLQLQGLRMVGPVIMRYGTPAQKAYYLPRILSGDDYWCQGFSEPDAGSDLASLRTRAVRDGDHYVINGSKIWTSHAHHANRMFALVRTAETEKRQAGISFLLIDMDTPGIAVRPIVTMDGAHEVNEVFFTDLRVPVANRVGAENQGWECAKYLLEFERAGGFASGQLRMALDRLHRLARSTGRGNERVLDDPHIAGRMADILCDLDALEFMELGVMSQVDVGQNPGPVASLLKVRSSEIRQSISELATDVVGLEGLRWHAASPLLRNDFDTPLDEELAAAAPIYLSERAHSIFAGSTEIQLTILARSYLEGSEQA
ncbi:MAG: acyl-CoA dehydrogenase family protein [Rhizobiaceae bacterium]|nr:acyl-CoA dehydrogenase family protein [Rhizobiaceae bacterium]